MKGNENIGLINEHKTALLIVDYQEKLVPSIENNSTIIFEIERLIDTFNILGLKIFFTEQNPEKLGKTIKSLSSKQHYNSFPKMSFSCQKCPELMNEFINFSIENIIICGLETHICILQTSIELMQRGYNVLIPRDAMGSRRNIDHETGLLRLFNSGAIPATTDMLLFELCKTAERDEFKSLSKIAKRTKRN